MRELKLYQGGHPFKNDDLIHMSDGFKEALLSFAQAIDTTKNFILDGAVISTAGPNTLITDGYISLEGEIYKIKAQSIPTISGTLHFYVKQYALVPDVPSLVVEVPSPSQLVNPNYGQLYQDTLRKDVHVERRVEIKFNAVGGDSATGLIYVTSSIPRLKQVRDALNRAAYKNEENLFTRTQSFGEGTLDTVDFTLGSETHKQLRLKNDGNTFIYNPGADVIVSRINLVDNTNANASSPNINTDDGTELTVHVITGSVRLIDYGGHTAGSYSTSGGIFIPPSVGGKEIYLPTGSSFTLVRSNNYSSAYEYFVKSVNSPNIWSTTDSTTLGASPGIRYTKIAEIEFTGINQSADTILDIVGDSTTPNGTFKSSSYAKITVKAEVGSNFATNASCEIRWVGGVGLYSTDFFARLEVKTAGQQIIRIYMRYFTAYSKFKISKINLDRVRVNSLQPLLTALPTATVNYPCVPTIIKPADRQNSFGFTTGGAGSYTNPQFTYGSNLKRLLVLPNINGRKVAVSFTMLIACSWAKNIGTPGNAVSFRYFPGVALNWTINGSLVSNNAVLYSTHIWPLGGASGVDGITAKDTLAYLTPMLDAGTDLQVQIDVDTIGSDHAPADFRTQIIFQNIQYYFEDEYNILN